IAIVNPVGNLPVLIGLTEDYEPFERRKVLNLAGVAAFIIIVVMAVGGRYLLQYVFHIELAEFMFGGGLILIVVGIKSILNRDVSRKLQADKMSSADRKNEQVGIAIS